MLKKRLFIMTCGLIFSTTSYADLETAYADLEVDIKAEITCCHHDEDLTISGSSTGKASAVDADITQKCKSSKCKAFISQSEDTSTVKEKCKSLDCKVSVTEHSDNVTSVNILQTDE